MGSNMRAKRMDAGLKASELAAIVGVSHSYIRAIENGTKPLTRWIAARVARTVGVRLRDLLDPPETTNDVTDETDEDADEDEDRRVPA